MSDRFDVLRYSDDTHRTVPAGDGQAVVAAHERESRRQQTIASLAMGFIAMVVVTLAGGLVYDSVVVVIGVGLGLGAVAAVVRAANWTHDDRLPELVVSDASARVVRDYVDDFDPADVSDPFT